MALTFAELGKLERLLISEGAGCEASVELNRTNEWLRNGEFGTVIKEPLIRLAEAARNADNKTAAEIALGSLILVRREFECDEGRCHSVLRFAQQRVDAIENRNLYWANVVLSARDEEDARALFDAAIGDRSYSTQELIAAATDFASRHQGENSILGRLAADLSRLVEVVEGGKASEPTEIARAALLYFAEKADAIPDDFGLVGLLDDAFIVQQAAEAMFPERANLTAYLEDSITRWPFLRNLRFDIDDRPNLISDYMLVNSALLLHLLAAEGGSTVVLVDDIGPLPYLLAIVGALANISEVADAGRATLKRGDRLMDRDGTGEAVFNRYYREEGTSLVICDAQVATHAQVVHPARRNASEILQTIPVAELGNFRRTATGVDKRTRNVIKVAVGDREAGPLEQLLGTTTPIMLDPRSPVVLVVAPIQKTRRMAENLKLFGGLARDVVPTGQLRRTEDGFDIEHWSTRGIGGEPMLCVVRSVDEAYEAVVSLPFERRRVSTVIAPVRPDSPDSSQLVRIHDSGVSVLAFASPQDPDAPDIFGGREFSFWLWDVAWFGQLYWPRIDSSTQPIVAYERRLRQRLGTKNQVAIVPFDALSAITCVLVELDQDGEDNEPLMDWMKRAWLLLLRFCRWLTPIGHDTRVEFAAAILELASQHHANRYRWSPRQLTKGKKIVELFEGALSLIGDRNPKHERLISLASVSPGATVWVPERDRAPVTKALADVDVRVLSRDLGEQDAELRVIPGWYGRYAMEKLAFASRFERQTLLLYEPEVEWFKRAQQRRERAISKVKGLVSRYAAIPLTESEPAPLSLVSPDSKRFGDVDDVFRKSIDRFVDRRRRDTGELVPATVVGFMGGSWAAFTLNHRVILVRDVVDGRDDNTEIAPATVSDLRVGDLVLLLRESTRDAVRERASVSLSERTVRAADLWKRALRIYTRTHPNLEELREKLKRAGCAKSVQTIRAWITHDYMIGPQQAESVIPAIAVVTHNTELRDRADECLAAISVVRSSHVTAGKWLANRVIERAKEWTEAGAMPDDLIELEERLVIATIDFVDTVRKEVPMTLVNRLQASA